MTLDAKIIQLERKGRFVLFCELEAQSTKEWLVQNLLGRGEASTMYGKPGDGKSVLAEDLGLHIGAGWPWHGRPVRRGAVLFVALERRKVVERRAIAFRENHGIRDLPFAIMSGVYDFRDKRAVGEIIQIVRQVELTTGEQLVLIIIDTLSRALCGGDENSSKDMGAIVSTTGLLQHGTGAHIMWLHHIPVDGSERMRGHGALLGAIDTTISVVKADTVRTATVIKANDSEEGERVAFTLKSVPIGQDGDGNPTTAPVVVPSEPLSPNKKATRWSHGLAVFREAALNASLEHGRDHRPAGDGPVVKACLVSDVRTEHKRLYVHNGEGDRSEAERKAWSRALTTARGSHLISGENTNGQDFIWLIS
jgi:hypothetical protein